MRRLRSACAIAAAIWAFACILFLTPSQACAASANSDFTVDKVSIDANVETDASLQVVERRVLTFSGTTKATTDNPSALRNVIWPISSLDANARVETMTIRVAPVDENGDVSGEWTTLDRHAFNIDLREGKMFDTPSFALDEEESTIYLFLDQSVSRVVVEVDYQVSNAVLAYRDVGELYWSFVPGGWKTESRNVTFKITLPVPAGTTVVPGETVRAWGHGPQNMTCTVGEDGSITYKSDVIPETMYGQAHIVFPASWLSHLSGEKSLVNRDYMRLEYAVSEEATWTDSWASSQINSAWLHLVCALICILAIAVAYLMYRLFGKRAAPATDESFDGVPLAVAGRLSRWNHESDSDITVTLAALDALGVIDARVLPVSEKDRLAMCAELEAAAKKAEENGKKPPRKRILPDIELTLNGDPNALEDTSGLKDVMLISAQGDASVVRAPDDDEDSAHRGAQAGLVLNRKVIEVLFKLMANGERTIRASKLIALAREDRNTYLDPIRFWRTTLSDQVAACDLFDSKSDKCRRFLGWLAIAMVVAGLVLMFLNGDVLSLIMLCASAAVVAYLSFYTRRLTQRGVALNTQVHRLAKGWKAGSVKSFAAAACAFMLRNEHVDEKSADDAAAAPAIDVDDAGQDPQFARVVDDWFAGDEDHAIAYILDAAINEAYETAQKRPRRARPFARGHKKSDS